MLLTQHVNNASPPLPALLQVASCLPASQSNSLPIQSIPIWNWEGLITMQGLLNVISSPHLFSASPEDLFGVVFPGSIWQSWTCLGEGFTGFFCSLLCSTRGLGPCSAHHITLCIYHINLGIWLFQCFWGILRHKFWRIRVYMVTKIFLWKLQVLQLITKGMKITLVLSFEPRWMLIISSSQGYSK